MPAQTVIQVRRDSAADWTSANPTLASGEHGLETDTGKFKIGNGSTAWTSLAYAKSGAAPELHASTHESGGTDELELAPAQITGTAVITSDSRLSDSRTPTAHKTSHEEGGSDVITVTSAMIANGTIVNEDISSTAAIASSKISVAAPANADTAKAVGYIGMPQTILNTGGLTLSAAHAGDHIYVTGTGQTITIPANSSVPFEIGTTIVIVNSTATSTIAITTDTLRLAGTTTTGTRTLAAWGVATLIKITSTTWIASGNGLS